MTSPRRARRESEDDGGGEGGSSTLAGTASLRGGILIAVAVLLGVAGDRPASAQLGVDLLLLGGRVGHEHLGEGPSRRGPVGVGAAAEAKEVLEQPVVLEDAVEDVAARRAGDVDLAVGHRPIMAENPP